MRYLNEKKEKKKKSKHKTRHILIFKFQITHKIIHLNKSQNILNISKSKNTITQNYLLIYRFHSAEGNFSNVVSAKEVAINVTVLKVVRGGITLPPNPCPVLSDKKIVNSPALVGDGRIVPDIKTILNLPKRLTILPVG
jgi:hypothetical protein